eukprot:c44018_g1_i1 orf=590-793(+)
MVGGIFDTFGLVQLHLFSILHASNFDASHGHCTFDSWQRILNTACKTYGGTLRGEDCHLLCRAGKRV